MQNLPKYLTEREVSELTRIGMKTLQQHRWLNKGIAYSRFGRTIRYRLDDVLAFMEAGRIEPDMA
jgi:hypothetical protein